MEIALICALIIFAGLLMTARAAIMSARRSELERLAAKGSRGARLAIALADSPRDFLSTVRLAAVLISVLAGAMAYAWFSEHLRDMAEVQLGMSRWTTPISVAVTVVILALVIMVFVEQMPRALGLVRPSGFAAIAAWPMILFVRLLWPFVAIANLVNAAILRAFNVNPLRKRDISEEEIKILIEQGREAGVIEEAEEKIMKNVFRLADRRVSALMTPRTDIVWLDIDDKPEQTREKIARSAHSRIPVGQGSLDNLLGLLYAKECLSRCVAGLPLNIREMLHEALIVPDAMPALVLLDSFRESPTNMALVADEYGSIQGMVTLNDVLQAIVGELPSAEDDAELQAEEQPDGSWLINGTLAIDEFKELFGLGSLPHEEDYYDTIAGFTMMQLERVPQVGDSFEWNQLLFEIIEMDGNRVSRIRVKPLGKLDVEVAE